MKAAMLATALAIGSGSAAAASYAWLDRADADDTNSHAAVSHDVYVRGFGWAWGELRLDPDTTGGETLAPPARHARDGQRRRDLMPWPSQDGCEPPGRARGKISMNLAIAPAQADGGGFADGFADGKWAARPPRVVR
ncbi:conserved exported hypothetical protein [Cupriavidus taiwanensis]|uniref:Uncharacterized protein n=1 Tax=Cupriavidus taiwanensis TaxID=164546 RepID=A0A976A9K7_9BURK|nr:hypothetical protein [Cupriavidus taiwanensis]SOY69578.1 conserved exported hypothetical protein [Cupriavidus taiwanensis]